MKKIITLLVFIATTFTLYAQVPQAICYQAVATDTRGNELVSQSIKVRLSILKGSSAGPEEWVETFSVTTDGFGLFDLTIGSGTRIGGAQTIFKDIKWGADKYYLKVEMDVTGGSNFILMGTNQMVSVPYALYAEKAGSAVSADSAKFALLSDSTRRAGIATTAITANYAINAGTAKTADTTKFAWLADSTRRAGISTTAITANYAIAAGTAKSSDTTKFAWLSDSTRRAGIATTAITANYATTAGTARRSDTATFAWLSDSTRRAARAYYSNYTDSSRVATTAVTAITAITAITAKTSDTTKFAWLSDSTRRAGIATTAITANYATNAGTARRSDTATFAWLSDSTRRAGIATTAITANYATTAGTARRSDTATFAWLSDSTRRAGTAMTAITANYAIAAGTARRSDTATFAWLSDSTRRAGTAITAITATTALTANYAINAGTARRSDTATFAWLADSSRRANFAIRAMMADSASRSAISYRAILADSANRAFSAVRATISDSASRAGSAQTAAFATRAAAANTALDDNDRDPTNEIQSLTFDTTTSTLKLSKPNGQFDLVSFNSTPLRSPGASIDYPFGILGEALLVTSNYTVPAGKTLFISAVNNPIEMADGKILNIEPGMPIIPTGMTVSSCFCSGILVTNQQYADPIILDFSNSLFEYIVPAGKYLVVKSGTNGSRNMSFLIDGTNFDFFTGSSSSSRLVVIPAGKRIRKGLTNVGSFIVTGYLLQK